MTQTPQIPENLIPCLLPDWKIKQYASQGMITPFHASLVREWKGRKVISYGLSSYGYDLRLSPDDFRIFRHIPGTVVDPKAFNDNNLVQAELHEDANGKFFILPAHSYGLGVALEYLYLPSNVTALFIGKSSYARTGLIANLTPGEAGWKGHLTLEFSNSSSADIRIYAEEGVVQALFLESIPCETPYGDSRKYQGQGQKVVTAKV